MEKILNLRFEKLQNINLNNFRFDADGKNAKYNFCSFENPKRFQ